MFGASIAASGAGGGGGGRGGTGVGDAPEQPIAAMNKRLLRTVPTDARDPVA